MSWQQVELATLSLNEWHYTPVVAGEMFRFSCGPGTVVPLNVKQAQIAETTQFLGNQYVLVTPEPKLIKLIQPTQFINSRRLALKALDSSLVSGSSVAISIEVYTDDSVSPSPEQEAETDSEVLKGQPLFLTQSGHLQLAQANNPATAKVCGLAGAYAPAHGSVRFLPDGAIERTDWTLITGFELLYPGYYYFLSPLAPGLLTTAPPISDGAVVACIGQALTPTRLQIEIQPTILL